MRIVFLCNEYPPHAHGGTGVFVKNLAEYLAGKEHGVIVIGAYDKILHAESYTENGVTVHRLPKMPEKSKLTVILNRWRFGRAVNRIAGEANADIIESFDSGAWFLFVSRRVPVVIRLHNGERYTSKNRGFFLGLIEYLSFFRPDAYIAVSEAIKQRFCRHHGLRRKYLQTHTRVIHNCVRLDEFPVLPIDNLDINRIVFVGTLKKVKGIETLIECYQRLLESNPGFKLHIIGPDSSEMGGYAKHLINKFDLKDKIAQGSVILHGRLLRREINELLRGALVCVVPSLFESFGLVIIEAMACFLPVIATRTGAAEEIIRNGYSGFLVNVGDVEGMERIILDLYAGKYDRVSLGNAARQTVEDEFSIDTCATKTLDYYYERIRESKGA
jgi:glycogen(starch) synthase